MEIIKIIVEIIIIMQFIVFNITISEINKKFNKIKKETEKEAESISKINDERYNESKKQRDLIIKKLDYLIHKKGD